MPDGRQEFMACHTPPEAARAEGGALAGAPVVVDYDPEARFSDALSTWSTVAVPSVRTRTERFLASFQSVPIRDEHRSRGSETPCLRDCGIPAAIAGPLIAWAEASGEGLVCTLEVRSTGRRVATWHWVEAFLQEAFARHTALFGEADLPPAARRMRDTGSFSALPA